MVLAFLCGELRIAQGGLSSTHTHGKSIVDALQREELRSSVKERQHFLVQPLIAEFKRLVFIFSKGRTSVPFVKTCLLRCSFVVVDIFSEHALAKCTGLQGFAGKGLAFRGP